MQPAIVASFLLAAVPPPATTPGAVARLVLTADDPSPALRAPSALARAAAARVAAVRDVKTVVPALREVLASESDPIARREQLRALILLGDATDVDLALSTAKGDSALMTVVVGAISRRDDAMDLFDAKLRPAGVVLPSSFLKQALWRRPGRLAITGAHFVGSGDAAGWGVLLGLARSAHIVMTSGVVAASLNSRSEDIRTQSVWYLVHTFASDPSKIDTIVRDMLAAPKEEASLREAFGRELLRRMLGGERKGDPRFTSWLQTVEADELLRSEDALFEYFTDDEFLTRKSHCGLSQFECRMPEKRGKSVGIQAVAPAPFMLPEVLPPGLTDAVLQDTRCKEGWLALGGATADALGRVKTATIVKPVALTHNCEPAVETLMKLSFVTPQTLMSPPDTASVILARAANETPCLDEDEPYQEPRQVDSLRVMPPKKIKSVEPYFPESVRRSMPRDAYALVIAQAVISHSGCVRSIQLVGQSPYGELNSATIAALVQWKFEPGRLDGKAVDVLFHLTVQYKLR